MTRRAKILLASSFLAAPMTVQANPIIPEDAFDLWSITGSVFTQLDYRNSQNNFLGFGEDRVDGFSELDLRFHREVSPYQGWEGSFFGAFSDSDFRSVDKGFLPERFYLKGYRGDTALPWQLELGDYFAFTSLRTLQTPLKGFRLELQYDDEATGAFHSGQAFAGSRSGSYEDLFDGGADDSFFAGYSHLVELESNSGVILSAVFNHQESGGLKSDAGQYSLAGEKQINIAGQAITVEGEASYLEGEIIQNGAVIQAEDWGFFASLSGEAREGLSYEVRYEDYDENFQPAGAGITADRQLVEGRIAKFFNNGLNVEARYQNFEDLRSTADPLETETFGLLADWNNVPGLDGLSFSADGFIRDVQNASLTQDNETLSGDLAATLQIQPDTSLQLRLSGQKVNARQAGGQDRLTEQAEVSVTKSVDYQGWSGSLSPGLMFRHFEQGVQTTETWAPRLSMTAFHNDGHNLSFNGQVLFNDGSNGAPSNTDVNLGARYSYTTGRHRFGAEADYISNDPLAGQFGEAYRFALNYTFQFDKPAKYPVRSNDKNQDYRGIDDTPLFFDGLPDIGRFTPNKLISKLASELEDQGLGAGRLIGTHRVYNGRFIQGLAQRQRLVLSQGSKNRLAKASLVIDFAAGRDANGLALEFDRILERLVLHYGTPERTIEEGDFTANLAADLDNGTFQRIYEWRLGRQVLRFGIPKRLDRKIRMELQFANSHPNIGQLLWSLEEIR